MWITILKMMLPYILSAIESYINSTSTDKDDVILDIAKKTSSYMCEQKEVAIEDMASILVSKEEVI